MDAPRTIRGEHALNADPAHQLRLLDLQALDSRLDALAANRAGLPQIAELADLATEHKRLGEELAATRAEVDQLSKEQAKADVQVDAVRTKRARDQQRLDAGSVGSARELQVLQSEIASLAQRQDELEDAELEVMERLEEVQGRLSVLEPEVAGIAARGRAAREARDDAWTQIDADAAKTAEERADVSAELPSDLLALYDKLRAQIAGGVAVATLNRGQCGGCRLQISPTDLSRLRSAPDTAVARCEECGRILVRSGDAVQ